MDQHLPPQTAPDSAPTSFITRAVNALTSPGELYEEVARTPVQNSSWVVPWLVMSALMGLLMYSFTSNAELFEQMQRPQREQMERAVRQGEMTQAQADQAMSFIENRGMFMAVGTLGGVVVMAIIVFGAPLAYRLGAKWMFGWSGSYRKMLEVYGLSLVIGIVGTLVTMIMMNLLQSIYAQPSLAYFLRDVYDEENFGHNVMASMNVFSVWQAWVAGIGIAAVSQRPAASGLMLSFGLWLAYVVVASFLGWGAR